MKWNVFHYFINKLKIVTDQNELIIFQIVQLRSTMYTEVFTVCF